MATGQEQDESRGVFHHICHAYADHGLYFTIVSPRRSWPDIVAHLDRYMESTYGKSGDSLRGDYGTFVSEVVPDY